MKEAPKIIFMGTAPFAVPTLDGLLQAGYDVSAVVTAPDRPAGRGKKLRQSAVKEYALSRGLALLQPEKLKDPAFVERLKAAGPAVQVVVAFRMLPAEVWKIPPLGTLNLHASLLPQFRGAAPINHAIMQGKKMTGITTFLIDEQIDTGRILKRQEVRIGEDETAGELHDRLMVIGAGLVLETLKDLFDGNMRPVSQSALVVPDEPLLPAPKIFKEDCLIPWERDAATVFNFIRGLSPSPAAFTHLRYRDDSRQLLKIFRGTIGPTHDGVKPGTLLAGKNHLEIACRDAYFSVSELQLEGKKKMDIQEFLRGFDVKNLSEAG